MNQTSVCLRELEARFERLIVDFQAMRGQVAILNNQLQSQQSQGGNQPGGGGGLIYSMVGVAIPAGGSITGVTVNTLVGGTATALPGTYTVYNQMQAATVVTKTIMLGANPDGTFSAISQSC